MSEEKKKFNLGDELRSIKTMPEAELIEYQISLETSLALLETQLTCYEEGVLDTDSSKDDLWYKQATFVFYGKKLLLRKVSMIIGEASPIETLINALHIAGVEFEVRNLPRKTTAILIPGIESKLSIVFKDGAFVEAR